MIFAPWKSFALFPRGLCELDEWSKLKPSPVPRAHPFPSLALIPRSPVINLLRLSSLIEATVPPRGQNRARSFDYRLRSRSFLSSSEAPAMLLAEIAPAFVRAKRRAIADRAFRLETTGPVNHARKKMAEREQRERRVPARTCAKFTNSRSCSIWSENRALSVRLFPSRRERAFTLVRPKNIPLEDSVECAFSCLVIGLSQCHVANETETADVSKPVKYT